MGGIAGIRHHRRTDPVAEAVLLRLRDAQAHRGPRDAGAWWSPDRRMALGHRRLSIVDPSPAGRQPMATSDGALRIAFDGEIYNVRTLRRELAERGFAFCSHSDAEVILNGYRAWGVRVFDKLRGMFAVSLWDEEARELLLARDPLGIKPLYLAESDGRVGFASEVQALRKVFDDGGIDVEALGRFLVWGSIPAPRTLYRNIRALEAGHFVRVRPGGIDQPTAYYRLEDVFGTSRPMSGQEGTERLRDALRESAAAHRVDEVPEGVLLSGGVDSSSLVGLLTEPDTRMRSVTLAIDGEGMDASALARDAAALYGSDHCEIPIGSDAIRERLPEAIRALDQPSAAGVSGYFVAEAAAAAGLRVAFSGLGGDELFGGSATYRAVPHLLEGRRRVRHWPPAVLRLASGAAERLSQGGVPMRLSKALRYAVDEPGAWFAERCLFSEAEVRRLLAPEVATAADGAVDELRARLDTSAIPPDERVSALELSQTLAMERLRDSDAVSMHHSIEVRLPLVDRELLSRVCLVPPGIRLSGPAKRQLREAPARAVPEELWSRPTQRVAIPFDRWLRSGSVALRLPRHDWLMPRPLARLERSFRHGRVPCSRMWQLHVLAGFLN